MSSDGFFVKPKVKKTNFNKTSDKLTKKSKEPKKVKPSKPFNKRQWREKKYSTGYKLDQWKKNHMKSTLRQYYKTTKNDDAKFDVQKIYNEAESEDESNSLQKSEIQEESITTSHEKPTNQVKEPKPDASKQILGSKKLKGFKGKAQLEYQRMQDSKEQRKEEIAKKLAEKAEKIKEYKKKKFEKFKKLSKKTKKGQPVMKDRIEMLLEQIQNNIKAEK